MRIEERLVTAIFAATLASATASSADAQRSGREPSRSADCRLVVDALAGRYNADDRRVYLDITLRNIGTTTCTARDSTTLTFTWSVSTYYLVQTNDGQWVNGAPLNYQKDVAKYPINGAAWGDIAASGTKTMSITPASGYSVSAAHKFVKSDIYVANAHVKFENNGQTQSSPMISKGILVEK